MADNSKTDDDKKLDDAARTLEEIAFIREFYAKRDLGATSYIAGEDYYFGSIGILPFLPADFEEILTRAGKAHLGASKEDLASVQAKSQQEIKNYLVGVDKDHQSIKEALLKDNNIVDLEALARTGKIELEVEQFAFWRIDHSKTIDEKAYLIAAAMKKAYLDIGTDGDSGDYDSTKRAIAAAKDQDPHAGTFSEKYFDVSRDKLTSLRSRSPSTHPDIIHEQQQTARDNGQLAGRNETRIEIRKDILKKPTVEAPKPPLEVHKEPPPPPVVTPKVIESPPPTITGVQVSLTEKLPESLTLNKNGKEENAIANQLNSQLNLAYAGGSIKAGDTLSFEVNRGNTLKFHVEKGKSGPLFNPDPSNRFDSEHPEKYAANPSREGNYDVKCDAKQLGELLARHAEVLNLDVNSNEKDQTVKITNDLKRSLPFMGKGATLILQDQASHGKRKWEFEADGKGNFCFVPNNKQHNSASNMSDPFNGKPVTAEQLAKFSAEHKTNGFTITGLNGVEETSPRTALFLEKGNRFNPELRAGGGLAEFKMNSDVLHPPFGDRIATSIEPFKPQVPPASDVSVQIIQNAIQKAPLLTPTFGP